MTAEEWVAKEWYDMNDFKKVIADLASVERERDDWKASWQQSAQTAAQLAAELTKQDDANAALKARLDEARWLLDDADGVGRDENGRRCDCDVCGGWRKRRDAWLKEEV